MRNKSSPIWRHAAVRRIFITALFTVVTAPSAIHAEQDTARNAATVVTRGPYLQVGTPTSVVVRWRTDVPTSSRVQYGLDSRMARARASSPIQHLQRSDEPMRESIWSVDDPAQTTEHELLITGLAPSTTYFYDVGTTSTVLVGGDGNHWFTTLPPAGVRQPVRAWILGDSGTANDNARAVRDAYYAYHGSTAADVWIMLGDNAYSSGTDSEYQGAVFDMYPATLRTTVLWPTRGNHDDLHSGSSDYYDIFTMPTAAQAGGVPSGTEAYYSYDYANLHFICLDSEGSDRSPNGAMMTWLAEDLAATSQEWIVAYWHHPPYTKGSHDSDSESKLEDMRENALPALEAGGVDLVLSGHSHSYERSFLLDGHYGRSHTLTPAMIVDGGDGRPGGDGPYRKSLGSGGRGTVYTVAGSSGKTSSGSLDHPIMITSLRQLGSLVLDVDGLEMTGTFLDDNGAIRDQFRIAKGSSGGGDFGKGEVFSGDPSSGSEATLARGLPNPFTFETTLAYSIPSRGPVRLTVYDANGRMIRELVDADRGEGSYTLSWNGRDASGERLASGVYFSVLEYGREVRTRKLVLVR